MKFWLTYCLIVLGVYTSQAQIFRNLGGQRAGISALTFLKIGTDPRANAMGGAGGALPGNGYSTFVNPAALTDLDHANLSMSNKVLPAGIHNSFLSGSIQTDYNGAWGLSLIMLNAGEMEERTAFQPNGTGNTFYAYNMGVGLSFAKVLSDRFSFGGTARYVREQLADYNANTFVADLGFLYKTDVKDLRFAVVLKNFGSNSAISGDFEKTAFVNNAPSAENYPPPTVFMISASMIPWKKEDQSLMAAIQLDHPNDNAENIRLGLEYEYMKLLFLRAGYLINVKDRSIPTFGAGFRTRIGAFPFMIDYSVEPTDYIGILHSIGLSVSFNNSGKGNNER